MYILEYIDELIEQGMNEDDAYRCADVAFNDNWDAGYDDEDMLIEAFETYGYEIFTPIQ